jgi:hypothetical protein
MKCPTKSHGCQVIPLVYGENSTTLMEVVSFTLRSYYLRCPLRGRLGESQSDTPVAENKNSNLCGRHQSAAPYINMPEFKWSPALLLTVRYHQQANSWELPNWINWERFLWSLNLSVVTRCATSSIWQKWKKVNVLCTTPAWCSGVILHESRWNRKFWSDLFSFMVFFNPK